MSGSALGYLFLGSESMSSHLDEIAKVVATKDKKKGFAIFRSMKNNICSGNGCEPSDDLIKLTETCMNLEVRSKNHVAA